ncbi:sigma factor [Pseudomonas plecoglossicida]|uniref:RNA polymerase sigma-70 region 2 domain-containing protein n=1 Tax=Pseudomonas plecoglossicida TaxID=70775 RepID=A0AAD0QX48_PSEDL|nr:sigma factor [Pseudomonas plecoglossicida]AXM96565.1 hypothetical protein DVB73_12640 [Pseudomonas plecoglossicida]QLB57313.1 hypothetical protein HAV28_22130 [Pseudomonas plecoglossicida]GLR39461.1 hypothetical protein GCM10011247_48600 [Pseudomonas plecoglossicida]
MTNNDIALVYTEHNTWLKQWLYRKLGCSAQAADLAQDTFLRILQSQQKAATHLTLQRTRCRRRAPPTSNCSVAPMRERPPSVKGPLNYRCSRVRC